MNKMTITALVVVILGIVGGGGYFFYVNQKDSQHTSTVSSSTPDSEKQAKDAAKSIDVAKILSGIESEYPTVIKTKIFTEENDPNTDMLGKPGSYVSGGAFWDTRTKYSDEYVDDEDKGRWGTDAGGAIEVYASEADAIKRGEYLGQFDQSSFLSPGAYKQVDNVVIRVSPKYQKSVQDDVIAFFEKQL